jgi:hypothetical protein
MPKLKGSPLRAMMTLPPLLRGMTPWRVSNGSWPSRHLWPWTSGAGAFTGSTAMPRPLSGWQPASGQGRSKSLNKPWLGQHTGARRYRPRRLGGILWEKVRPPGEFKPLGSDVPPPESAVGRDHCAVLRTGRTVGWGSVGCPLAPLAQGQPLAIAKTSGLPARPTPEARPCSTRG